MHILIGSRKIGPGLPCFVIAEVGVNHNGNLDTALKLIDIAADAGADAVKFQTFAADRLVTRDAPKASYQHETTADAESHYSMIAKLELSAQDHHRLVRRCEERGILFLSSPFDEQSADLLHELQVPAFKIPSGELTNLPYLAHIAHFGLPMIVSTGMATLGEVETAVELIRSEGSPPLVLLHCVSNYPAAAADVNLRAIGTLSQAFGVVAGYSDHTLGLEVSLAAVALGACVVEKHFTTNRDLPGPDHRSSIEPAQLRNLVAGIRVVEAALGDGCKRPTPSEASIAAVARKSIVVVRNVAAGVELLGDDLSVKRPGTGVPPALRDAIVGRRAKIPIAAGSLLSWEMLA